MTAKVTTQAGVESLSQVDPLARASQVGIESLSQSSPLALATQVGIEALSSNDDLGADQQPRMFFVT